MSWIAATAFFISGFAALLYQVVWQRLLGIFSGTDVYSITVIVAAFMGGLGAGSVVGGAVADRVSRRVALLLFAGAELAIAGFGYFSALLFHGVLYERLGALPLPASATAVILFLSLLWPTFFMGASLPLLARTLTSRLDRAALTIGGLYAVNTLGAAAGALVSTWILIPRFGLEGSVRVGAVLNVACAALMFLAVAFWVPQGAQSAHDAGEAGTTDAAVSADPVFAFWRWVAASALSGFIGLSLEIVWFRLLGVMVKSSAFTFGTLLGVHLCGIGLGSLAGSVLVRRMPRPARAFFALQSGVALGSTVLLTCFLQVVAVRYTPARYFGRSNPVDVRESIGRLVAAVADAPYVSLSDVPWGFLLLYVGLPLVLVLPPALLMGMSFPVLQRVVHTDLALVGRRTGNLTLANILGSVAGTTVTGVLLLESFGTTGTISLLTLMGGILLWQALALTFREWPPRLALFIGGTERAAVFVATCVTLPLLMAAPGEATLWKRLHGSPRSPLIVNEDGSGVAAIRVDDRSATLYVNGLSQSGLPYGDVHTALGAIPAFLHHSPRSALVIGMGSGDTVHAVAGRPEIERITCIEIVRPQLETLRTLSKGFGYRGLESLLGDPRIEAVFGDGRVHLMRSKRTYDLIEADALRPNTAFSGLLFSEEYFALVRDRLNPRGLATTWAPTERVFNTFVRVFPYVVQLPNILIGSREPIALDRAALAERLTASKARDYYAAAGVDIDRLMAEYLAAPRELGPEFPRSTVTAGINTDLFPRDEYDLGE